MKYRFLAFAAASVIPLYPCHAQTPPQTTAASCTKGFVGNFVAVFNPDGRTVTLKEPYAFVDSNCKRWAVPAGATVDGASIPQVFWTVIGGPFEGKYRAASVIHDWYCDRRSEPWQSVDLMFYEAMLASGVSPLKAQIMYAAVYAGGPRWSSVTVRNVRLVQIPGGVRPEDVFLHSNLPGGSEVQTLQATLAEPSVSISKASADALIASVSSAPLPLAEIERQAVKVRPAALGASCPAGSTTLYPETGSCTIYLQAPVQGSVGLPKE